MALEQNYRLMSFAEGTCSDHFEVLIFFQDTLQSFKGISLCCECFPLFYQTLSGCFALFCFIISFFVGLPFFQTATFSWEKLKLSKDFLLPLYCFLGGCKLCLAGLFCIGLIYQPFAALSQSYAR